jgi:hypothetical protein
LKPDACTAKRSQNGFINNDNKGLAKATTLVIFERCKTCPVVLGFATDKGKDFITAIPFQLEPTIFPIFLEKPPRIPLFIEAMIVKFKIDL